MSVDWKLIHNLTDGVSPVDTDQLPLDREISPGVFKAYRWSYLALRTSLATLWNNAISSAVSGLATSASVIAGDAATLAGALTAIRTATPSTPSRTLNSNFTPHATKWTLCAYTISISCALSLTGGQTGAVELRSDTNATPTTARGRVGVTNSGTLIVGLAITNAQEQQVVYLCPPGHNVRLVSSGTGTISITSQAEIVVS